MTVTFNKISIVAAGLMLLGGCSLKGVLPDVQWNVQENVTQAGVLDTSASEACVPDAGTPFHFRKVILVAGTTSVPDVARDLPGLASLTSRRLQTHLDALERFNVFATHDSSFESMGAGTAIRVRQIGRQFASQFVVKLELEDLTIYSSGGWVSRLLGSDDQRNVLIKLNIHDTEHGTLFHSQEFHRTVSGDVIGYPGNGTTVSTPWFKSDLGKQIDDMLLDMSLEIKEKLACVPFSAEVTAVKGGDIHINAGYLHGIRPGDTLRVYRITSDTVPLEKVVDQGGEETWIKVDVVYPSRSVVKVADSALVIKGIDTGDVVRAW